MQGGEYAIEKRMNDIDEAGNKASDVDKRLYTVLEVALEMVKRGYHFEPVSILESDARDFVLCKNGSALRLPFIALDGLGMKVAESIVEARNEKDFSSREDVKDRTRVSGSLFNKLDALGAFGDLPESGQINLFEL
jgi:DNA polymerase-3 subunit alpha (Gram-positive type)